MNWLTIAYSMEASACLTLAFINVVVWLRQRRDLAHLFFSLAAISVAAIAAGELAMARAATPEQFGLALRWIHIPICSLHLALVGFVCVYFPAVRIWLASLVCATRLLAVTVNFCVWPNLNYKLITGLHQLQLIGGETAAVATGVPSSLTWIGRLSAILFVVFVVDATISSWRRGGPRERRRVLLVGGSLSFFVLVATAQSQLVLLGLVRLPYLISFTFAFPLLVMGYELGTDVVRAARLARELQVSRTELHTSEQRLKLAAKAAAMEVWEWDIDADEVWISEETRAKFQIRHDEKVTFRQFITARRPVDREPLENALKKVLEGADEYDAEYRVTHTDGNIRWFASRGKVQQNGDQRRLMRGVSIDITQRRQAEELFRLVVEAAPSAMIMVNPQATIILANAQAEVVFGYSRDEMLGQPIDILVPAQGRAIHRAQCDKYFLDPKSRAGCAARELQGRRKDGSDVPLEIALSPIEGAEGTLVLATITDTTARRQAEREAVLHRNELAHLSRVTMLGELSGSIAHELNQPLTAILSNAQAAQRFLAQAKADPQEVQEILKDIIAADHRAGETIRRLRMLFKNGEVQHQDVDVNAMVQEVLKFLNSDLINNRVTTTVEFADSLPPTHVDRVQIQQVLINLIVNACDAMADTSATERTILLRTQQADRGPIHISISDHGSGIGAERLETIFKPFVTTKSQGMGLGLAVCRTIVSAHGGKLWATNNSDRGATFHLVLPAVPVAANSVGIL